MEKIINITHQVQMGFTALIRQAVLRIANELSQFPDLKCSADSLHDISKHVYYPGYQNSAFLYFTIDGHGGCISITSSGYPRLIEFDTVYETHRSYRFKVEPKLDATATTDDLYKVIVELKDKRAKRLKLINLKATTLKQK